MKTQPCRLYIFTGKGGVGKSTLSKAFVRYLNEHDHEAIYLSFRGQSIGSANRGSTEVLVNGIKEVLLDLEDCARGYIEKRLNSKMIGSWIVKTPFFRALINMVPGFNYLIFLGKILEMGKANPRLIVVLDAPASGHALTMVESTTNFQQIFESGVVFDDAKKMLARLNDPEYTKIHVVSLPSLMSWQEAIELKSGLKERTPVDVEITVNNCIYPLVADQLNELPLGIKEKATNEKRLLEENQSEMCCILPHSLASDPTSIELDLVGTLSRLI
jgi:anion-transporting  ArsA/GET3 family ATPase